MSPKFLSLLLRLKGYLILFISGVFILMGCVPQKKIDYLQLPNANNSYENIYTDHVLKPYDELYIQISNMNEESANVFATVNSAAASSTSSTGASLTSYIVDKDGNVELPVLGKMFVKGKTIADFKKSLKDTLSTILSQPIIDVKLVNKYFSVLGEVNNPGHYVFPQEKLNILDAISIAGDITTYGKRDKVYIIRNENNYNKIYQVNVLKSDLLASNFYYLQSGDIVYIKSHKIKQWGFGDSPYSIFLTLFTSVFIVLYTQRGN